MTIDKKQIPGQMSLFDLMFQESLETIPEEVMAERIGTAIGVKFVKDKFFGDYRAKVGRSVLSVEYQRYNTLDEKNGRRFIGCDVQDGNCGACSPCDSVQESVEWFMRRKRK